jgi:hypothetical protein
MKLVHENRAFERLCIRKSVFEAMFTGPARWDPHSFLPKLKISG